MGLTVEKEVARREGEVLDPETEGEGNHTAEEEVSEHDDYIRYLQMTEREGGCEMLYSTRCDLELSVIS